MSLPKPEDATYCYEDYLVTTPEEVRSCLDEHGVAILSNILDPSECEALHKGIWNELHTITSDWEEPLDFTNPTSWPGLWRLYPKNSMLLQHQQVGHFQSVWDVRQNPKVAGVFSDFWNVPDTDLLTSMDGISVHLPSEQTGRGWARRSPYHCDQSFTKHSLETVQGWVTANDIRDGDATLAFLRGSHKFQAQAAERFRDPLITKRQSWNMLSPEMVQWYIEHGCEPQCIRCPAGSLVLWDSRTIHSGREPLKSRSQPNDRCIVYVTMTPRSKASEATLHKRRKAFEERRMTGHHPHAPRLFSVHPWTRGGELPVVRDVPEPELTGLGQRLAGL